jgi:mRNA interferase RelE/StbE
VSYQVNVAHEAETVLDRLDSPTERRIRHRLVQLAEDPFDSRLSAPLVERAGVRKSRVGGWRILFTVDRDAKVIPSANSRNGCSRIALQTRDLRAQNADYCVNWGTLDCLLLPVEYSNFELIRTQMALGRLGRRSDDISPSKCFMIKAYRESGIRPSRDRRAKGRSDSGATVQDPLGCRQFSIWPSSANEFEIHFTT